QTLRINAQDFEVIKTIATGAVGRVCLVVGKSDRKEYAMKILKKTDLLTRREAGFFMEERNALVFGNHSRWITTLYAAFQDDENLYLVMEYIPGGSLRTFLNAREVTLTEDEARFYVAEMVLALEEVHRLHYIHRDLKPDNVLIDHDGHLKLGDFGSCIRICGDGQKVRSRETVGTPDYISPEILRAQEGNVSYGEEVDLWSLGIILYEMLFDEVPFYSESLVSTYGKIMDHENTLEFPDDVAVSFEAISLMKSLICNPEQRLSLTSIKTHSWFREFSWDKVLKLTPPFVPELEGPRDTHYFGDEDLGEAKKTRKQPLPKTRDFAGQNLPFIGYTY
ncbi:kinase-like protein, partial [Rhizoclosmatium globosum]